MKYKAQYIVAKEVIIEIVSMLLRLLVWKGLF